MNSEYKTYAFDTICKLLKEQENGKTLSKQEQETRQEILSLLVRANDFATLETLMVTAKENLGSSHLWEFLGGHKGELVYLAIFSCSNECLRSIIKQAPWLRNCINQESKLSPLDFALLLKSHQAIEVLSEAKSFFTKATSEHFIEPIKSQLSDQAIKHLTDNHNEWVDEGERLLEDAVKGKISLAKLRKSNIPYFQDRQGMGLLAAAAISNNPEAIEAIEIFFGESSHTVDIDGLNAVSTAALFNADKSIETLREILPDDHFSIRDHFGSSPIEHAISSGADKALQMLIKAGFKVDGEFAERNIKSLKDGEHGLGLELNESLESDHLWKPNKVDSLKTAKILAKFVKNKMIAQ